MKNFGKVLAVVAGVVVVGVIGGQDDGKKEVKVAVETKAPQNEVIANKATEKPVKKATSTPKPKEKVSLESVVTIVQTSAEGMFEYANTYYDETINSIVVQLTNNGTTIAAYQATKNKNLRKKWVDDVTHSTNDFCLTVKGILKKSGYKNTNVVVQILNDLNKDNVLVMSRNGKTVIDVVQGIGVNK